MSSLQQECVECNTDPATCTTRPTTVRGAGVPNTDLIIYVSINCSDAPSGVVAFAGACQMESQLDRWASWKVHALYSNYLNDGYSFFCFLANIIMVLSNSKCI